MEVTTILFTVTTLIYVLMFLLFVYLICSYVKVVCCVDDCLIEDDFIEFCESTENSNKRQVKEFMIDIENRHPNVT